MTVCIVVNEEKFQSHAVTLTEECPILNSSLDIFICYNIFKFQVPRVLVLTDTQTDTNTKTHKKTYRHTPSNL